jgi:hypothetical protein
MPRVWIAGAMVCFEALATDRRAPKTACPQGRQILSSNRANLISTTSIRWSVRSHGRIVEPTRPPNMMQTQVRSPGFTVAQVATQCYHLPHRVRIQIDTTSPAASSYVQPAGLVCGQQRGYGSRRVNRVIFRIGMCREHSRCRLDSITCGPRGHVGQRTGGVSMVTPDSAIHSGFHTSCGGTRTRTQSRRTDFAIGSRLRSRPNY